MDTDRVSGIKSSKFAKLSAPSKSHHTSASRQSDQITFSPEAFEVCELNRFVNMLRTMPDVRQIHVGKEYNYSSPTVLRAVARKIAESV